jgi:hypothetical protein
MYHGGGRDAIEPGPPAAQVIFSPHRTRSAFLLAVKLAEVKRMMYTPLGAASPKTNKKGPSIRPFDA